MKTYKQYFQIGEKVNHLTILEFIPPPALKIPSSYKVRCDCGNEKVLVARFLAYTKPTSCGMSGCMYRSYPEQQGAKNRVLRSYKRQARNRKLEWSLSDTEALELFSKPCFYCNVEFSNNCKSNVKTYETSFSYNGIDRVDNSQGYVVENCVPCCRRCNSIKKNIPVKMIHKIVEFLTPHR